MTKHLKNDWIYDKYIAMNYMVNENKGGMLPLLSLELQGIVVT